MPHAAAAMSLIKDQAFPVPAISIESIFESDHSKVQKLSQSKTVTLIATGDVIPARSVNAQVLDHKDFNWPYLKTASLTKSGDITFINLESPLISSCPVVNDGFTFCGDAKNIEGLKYAGFDVANLANNHMGNYGKDGVLSTKRLLSDAGILFTGVDGPVYKEVKGVKFAFLGYSEFGSWGGLLSSADSDKIAKEVSDAKKNADVVVVSFHWGAEYVSQPGQKQVELAHLAVDSGADLVIGNHPHWIQPVELYKNGFITYAHGNFVFDQMWSEETRQGVVGRYVFYNKKLVDVSFTPIYIQNYGQPELASSKMSNQILDNMKKQSLLLKQNMSKH